MQSTGAPRPEYLRLPPRTLTAPGTQRKDKTDRQMDDEQRATAARGNRGEREEKRREHDRRPRVRSVELLLTNELPTYSEVQHQYQCPVLPRAGREAFRQTRGSGSWVLTSTNKQRERH